jgi:hypothetical protein
MHVIIDITDGVKMSELLTGDFLQSHVKSERHRRGPQKQPNRKKAGYALEEKRVVNDNNEPIFPVGPFHRYTHSRKPLFDLYQKCPQGVSIDLWNNVVTKVIWMNMKLTGSRVTGHLRGDEGKYNRFELQPFMCDIVVDKCSDHCGYCGVGLNYGVGKQATYYYDMLYTETPSIDRIDSDKPYVHDNIILACTDCNTRKGDGNAWRYEITPYIEDSDIAEIIKQTIRNYPGHVGYIPTGNNLISFF